MNSADSDYGLWGLVVIHSIVFIGFAYSFFKPVNVRDWRSFGAYSAVIVAGARGSEFASGLGAVFLGADCPVSRRSLAHPLTFP